MSAIFGILKFDSSAVNPRDLERMGNTLAPRRIGPSIATSALASGASSPNGTRNPAGGRARFPGAKSSENSA